MRRVCLPGLAGLLGLALMAGGTAFAADQPGNAESRRGQEDVKTKNDRNNDKDRNAHGEQARGRRSRPRPTSAPDSCRNRIYPCISARIGSDRRNNSSKMKAVEDKYAGEIKELESKLDDVRAKRMSELHALLSEAQKKALAEAQPRRRQRFARSERPWPKRRWPLTPSEFKQSQQPKRLKEASRPAEEATEAVANDSSRTRQD